MKLTHLLILAAVVISPIAQANSELLSETKAEKSVQAKHNKQREAGFKLTEKQVAEKLANLKAQRDALEAETEALSVNFSENEQTLAQLEENLRLEVGSLGELFGVVRQSAKDLQLEMSDSVTQLDRQTHNQIVDAIVDAKALPSLTQLQGFWSAMLEQIQASSQVSTAMVPYVNGAGEHVELEGMRIGSYGIIAKQGYIDWNTNQQFAKPYLVQPKGAPTLDAIVQGEQWLTLDPSRGQLIEQLALTPTLKDRLEQGGLVGKIILGLLAIGLLIVMVRGLVLLVTRAKVASQLKSDKVSQKNPLGRILSVHSQGNFHNAEALEMRLLESIVDEQRSLEKGLSMLKLMAALAPMLGLLGTVTGMIETFQTITQFGNGDPKIMAGGISMALVTTVLGLVAAIPLLIGHNILSTQAETIRTILEKHSIALVATQMESEQGEEQAISDIAQERVA
ncbi:MotA/TolQ/ExbB proton channel family protein [Vibrio sp. SCSIO 43136]|uniref:MotA/TolQ/ExbB proton channel family protein n=1 Tax=Vibrio sp. SCSIO 43136 TaxID=2819101 RepID=UPI0020756655|nr:MotA/TolQ/ExbB proton channel family protein [Vibrio sp. SCSIO 43136]USD67019.1 MotA/TolQ/ExbB proton channel family protein [Vibrio sp. SCSIO 43136]